MSTMETPPPGTTAAPPDRHCPRCGSALSPDQEWCLNCGAAAGTEVVEARGWRVPLYLGGGLAALALIGVVLAIVALASRNETVAQTPAPPAATPTPSPLATTTPLPSITATPSPGVPTVSPTPSAPATVTPEPTPEDTTGDTDTDTTDTSSSFPGWTGNDGDYTIIIESARSQSGAERVAQEAQDAGESPGILNSDDYSSLNGGYYVVFLGSYASKSEADDALDGVRESHPDAYVRQIST